MFSFNGDRSRILMSWSPTNAAWLVWREDGNHQATVRIHNDREAACEDYRARIEFVRGLMPWRNLL